MSNTIFLCWSGVRALNVAIVLDRYLERIITGGAKTWLSQKIPGGGWFEAIQRELEDARLGIVCLTQSNMSNPWLHFEAGAIGKLVKEKAIVWVLCIGFPVGDVPKHTPFYSLQRWGDSKEQIQLLFQRIDDHLQSMGVAKTEDLVGNFEREWPFIQQGLADAERVEMSAKGPFAEWTSDSDWDDNSIGKELESVPARVERVVRETVADLMAGPRDRELWTEIDVENPFLPPALDQMVSEGVLKLWAFRGSADVYMISTVPPAAVSAQVRRHGLGDRLILERPPGEPREIGWWDYRVVQDPNLPLALSRLVAEGVLAKWDIKDSAVIMLSNVGLELLRDHLARFGFDARDMMEKSPWQDRT